jgi:hypothetical protein
MQYLNSSYLGDEKEILERALQKANPDGTTSLIWSIGDLSPQESKTIGLLARSNGYASLAENKVEVSGSALGNRVDESSGKAIEEINVGE